jgi:hypothetical protein
MEETALGTLNFEAERETEEEVRGGGETLYLRGRDRNLRL